MAERTYWFTEVLTGDSADPTDDTEYWSRQKVSGPNVANLISSRTEVASHMPALDIDLPARLLPSATEGHFHLFIDKEMSWDDYEKLLKVLGEVGILEEGYVSVSLKRRQTFLRYPADSKPKADLPDPSVGDSPLAASVTEWNARND